MRPVSKPCWGGLIRLLVERKFTTRFLTTFSMSVDRTGVWVTEESSQVHSRNLFVAWNNKRGLRCDGEVARGTESENRLRGSEESSGPAVRNITGGIQ